MTFPQSKPASRIWWANDATQRNAIGSNDGLDVGDLVFQLSDNTWYRCDTVTGGDTSTWLALSAAPATWGATLAVVGGDVSGGISPTLSSGDDLLVAVTNTSDIGTDAARFKDLFLSNFLGVNAAVEADGVAGFNDIVLGGGSGAHGFTIFGGSSSTLGVAFTDTAGVNRAGFRYNDSSGIFDFRTQGTLTVQLTPGVWSPVTTGLAALGTSSLPWSDLHLSGECFAGSYNSDTRAVTDADSPVTWAASNGWLDISAAGGVVTVNLPAISDGKTIFANITDISNDITFDGSGSETINAALTKVITTGGAGLYRFDAHTATDWLMVLVGTAV